MLTSCPECHTCFRVTQDQLDRRRGLVRCGRCSAVFNAYDTLLPELTTPASDETALTPAGASPPPTSGPPSSGAGSGPQATASTAAEVDSSAAQTHPAEDDRASASKAETLPPIPPRALQADRALTEVALNPSGLPPALQSPDTPEAILLSALPSSRKRGLPGWRSLAWLLAGLLLTATFLLQLVYFLRAELTAVWPESRPLLEEACLWLGCRIPLPRELSALRIEASSLETDPEDASRATLRVTLSNRSDRVIAWPHLILNLNDVRDFPIARRPIPPAEYLPDAGLVARGMAPRQEQEIRLELEIKGLTAYGYKLDKQYP